MTVVGFRAHDGATPTGLPAPRLAGVRDRGAVSAHRSQQDVGWRAAGLSRSPALEVAKQSAELESVVLARLRSAPLTDAVPSVDGRDFEPGHRGVAVRYFTETSAAGCDAVRSGQRASKDVYSAMTG
jgi:hypothetical protein